MGIVDKREEAITLQEIERQHNIIAWYKGINKEMTELARIKIEELEEKLKIIRGI